MPVVMVGGLNRTTALRNASLISPSPWRLGRYLLVFDLLHPVGDGPERNDYVAVCGVLEALGDDPVPVADVALVLEPVGEWVAFEPAEENVDEVEGCGVDANFGAVNACHV